MSECLNFLKWLSRQFIFPVITYLQYFTLIYSVIAHTHHSHKFDFTSMVNDRQLIFPCLLHFLYIYSVIPYHIIVVHTCKFFHTTNLMAIGTYVMIATILNAVTVVMSLTMLFKMYIMIFQICSHTEANSMHTEILIAYDSNTWHIVTIQSSVYYWLHVCNVIICIMQDNLTLTVPVQRLLTYASIPYVVPLAVETSMPATI